MIIDWTQIISNVGIFGISSGLLVWLIKSIIETNLKKSETSFEYSLLTDLEKLKIYESALHIHKAELFSDFAEYVTTKMLDKDYMQKLSTPKVQKEMRDLFMKTGYSLFFYSNDTTVKKFVEFRRSGLDADKEPFEKEKIILILAQLFVEMRKDLGYVDTECNIDDFLTILLTDWTPEKSEEWKQKYSVD
jgi:hypothetical protein